MRPFIGQLSAEQIGVADHDREQIVEIMGDAPRQSSNGFKALCLVQPLFQLHLGADIVGEDECSGWHWTEVELEMTSAPVGIAERVDHALLNALSQALLEHREELRLFDAGKAVHHAIAESLYTKLPYNIEKDFLPVTVVAYVPNVVVFHPKHSFKTIKEFIDFAKANPGKLNFGSAGNGTSHHLAVEMFKTITHTQLTHVPYKGAGPMMTDLLAGQVDFAFDGMGTSAQQIKAGKLRPLAVTTTKRAPLIPDVPTLQEAGVPGYDVTTWYALWAVKGTPREAVERMYAETVKALAMPDIKEYWAAQGADPGGQSPEQFAAFLHSEIAKWAKVVKDSGAKIDN